MSFKDQITDIQSQLHEWYAQDEGYSARGKALNPDQATEAILSAFEELVGEMEANPDPRTKEPATRAMIAYRNDFRAELLRRVRE